jgi:D-glycero-D-manno-heptose 1,7-bisphosphate phosphatase
MPTESGKKRPAVFLDRDGTLMEDVDYCREPGDVRIYSGVPDALRRLKERGFANVIITNQSGIARGLLTVPQYKAVNAALLDGVGTGNIDAVYFCPDGPDSSSPRRKPEPAMIFEAARDLALDLQKSFFVGDKASDIECGRNAGVRTVLVRTGYGRDAVDCQPDHAAEDFPAAVEYILQHE